MSSCVDCQQRKLWLERLDELPTDLSKVASKMTTLIECIKHLSKRVDSQSAEEVRQNLNRFFSLIDQKIYYYEIDQIAELTDETCKRILKITHKDKDLLSQFAEHEDLKGIRGLLAIGANLENARQLYQQATHRDLNQDLKMKLKSNWKTEDFFEALKRLDLTFGDRANYHLSTDETISYAFTEPFVSKAFHDGEVPIMFLLVERRGVTYPRLCWLSRSQMVWRITTKLFEDWISKSELREEAMALPVRANLHAYELLEKTLSKGGLREISETEIKKILSAIVTFAKHPKEGGKAVRGDGPARIEYKEGEETLMDSPSFHASEYSLEEVEALRINFSNKICEQKLTHVSYDKGKPILTNLTASVFQANNRIRCIFIEHQRYNHVFLAAAEYHDASITKYGIRRRVVQLGDLSTPLKEYRKMFKDRMHFCTDSEKHGSSTYVHTWNYLRTLPAIRDYYREYKKARVPEEI